METSWIEGLPPLPEQVVAILVGAVLLLAGRRIFWLVLGVAAFTAGALLSTYLPIQLAPEGRLLLALVCGLVAIALGVVLRRVGIALGGLLIGALLGLHLVQAFSSTGGPVVWLAVIVGGLLGWFLGRHLVEGALVVLSSIMGAMMIVQHLPLDSPIDSFALLGLALVGVAIQSRGKKG